MDASIYFIVFLIMFLVNLAISRVPKGWPRRTLIVISILILVCFIGFRYNVGTDYGSYLRGYRSIKEHDFIYAISHKTEPLVGALYWIFSKVFPIDYWIFFMFAIVSIIPIYLVNKKYDYRYLAYSMLIYSFLFLPFNLNGMRQGAAISLVLLSASYMLNSKKKGAIVSFILAISFHRSAILVLPHYIAYLLCKRKKWNFTIINIIVSVAMSVFILLFLEEFLSQDGSESYAYYGYILRNISADNITLSRAIGYIPLAILAAVTSMKKGKKEKDESFYRNMVYTGIVYTIIGSSAQFLSRIGLYFLPFSIIALPYQFENKSVGKRALLKTVLVTYLVMVFISLVVMKGSHDILPYQTWIGID